MPSFGRRRTRDHHEPATEQLSRIESTYERYDSDPARRRRLDPSRLGNAAILLERQAALSSALHDHGIEDLGDLRVLEVGCGNGDVLASLLALGARADRLRGVDLIERRVMAARRAHPDLSFECQNAENMNFPRDSFDVVLAFTVFSSILDRSAARRVAVEIERVLSKDGIVLWYDMRYPNPWNRSVRPLRRRDVEDLFPSLSLDLRPVTLIPTLARLVRRAETYRALLRVRPLRSHYLGVMWRNRAAR